MNVHIARAVYAAATVTLGEQSVFRYLKDARHTHTLDRVTLAERQATKLFAILRWAVHKSPYYSQFLGDYRNDNDPHSTLEQLPLLEKSILQTESSRIRVPEFRGRIISKSTGGSTGAPIRIIKDADGIAREMATTWAALESYGIRIGDRSVRFWGTPLTAVRRLRFKLTDVAMNRVRLSAFELDAKDLERYWQRCLRWQPHWFYGYASLIHLFAEWIEDQNYDGRRLGLKVVVPTSEPLTREQRNTIARVFGAPVFDEYGCGEVGAMAYGCRYGRLHLMTENVLVEVVDEELRPVPPGDSGEVIVTDLTNHAMPLIRYRLGDRAIRGVDCECGQGFPVLEQVLGRIHDVVFTPLGRRWHGEKIDYLMSQIYGEFGGFRQYQVVQVSATELQVRLLAEDEIAETMQRRIQQYVHERLDGMTAHVVRVSNIERAPSGKIRVVRNDYLPERVQPQT